jgi:hypothetical protein
MGFGTGRNLISHSRLEDKLSTILELCDKFSFQDKQDVPARTPVVGEISGSIFNHPHADVSERDRSPESVARNTRMLGLRDVFPVRCHEWNVLDLHQ